MTGVDRDREKWHMCKYEQTGPKTYVGLGWWVDVGSLHRLCGESEMHGKQSWDLSEWDRNFEVMRRTMGLEWVEPDQKRLWKPDWRALAPNEKLEAILRALLGSNYFSGTNINMYDGSQARTNSIFENM